MIIYFSLNTKINMDYSINTSLKNEWLLQCADDIRDIAEEFINITQYISNDIFDEYLLKSLNEMLEYYEEMGILHLQFYIPDYNKSNYWVIKKLLQLNIDDKYLININDDPNSFDDKYPIIITDDASYSGSQISSYISDYINMDKYKLFILIPFISKIAIIRITKNRNDKIKFIEKNRYEMKPLTELMEIEKIKKLFNYYGSKTIIQYPIYFNHKIADSYSSFPLIYSYGVIPNEKNKKIIDDCKMKLVSLKTRFDELDRIIFLNNCINNIKSDDFDINNPIYPISPYKIINI